MDHPNCSFVVRAPELRRVDPVMCCVHRGVYTQFTTSVPPMCVSASSCLTIVTTLPSGLWWIQEVVAEDMVGPAPFTACVQDERFKTLVTARARRCGDLVVVSDCVYTVWVYAMSVEERSAAHALLQCAQHPTLFSRTPLAPRRCK